MPTGSYAVAISITLPAPFGTIEGVERLRLVDPGPDALDRVIARALDENDEARWEAVDELPLFPQDGDRVVPVLIRLAREPEFPFVVRTLYALASFPDQADEFTPVLIEILDGDEWVRGAAASVLGDVGAPGLAEPALTRLAESGDEEIKPYAREALEALGARANTIE